MAIRSDKKKPSAPLPRKSFSGFSQSYSGELNGNKPSYSERVRRRNIMKWVLIFFGLAALFIIGFVVTDVLLDISKRPPETTAFILSSLTGA